MSTRVPVRHLGVATLAAATLLLAGCGSSNSAAAPAASTSAKVDVVTSTNVYGSVAAAVGGDRVTVTSLIDDPAADPHSYESTPADAAKVGSAKVVVENGGGYDDFMTKIQTAAPAPDRATIDVVRLSGFTAPAGGELNEHVWYDLPTMEKLVSTLASDLTKADPGGAATYQANAAAYTGKIKDLETKTAAIAAAHHGARVAITEPVPGYLIQAAKLTNATPPEFSEAVEEDTDPPAAVLQATLAQFGGNPVKVLLLNAQTQTPTTDQIKKAAQTAGVPVVDVTETLPAGATDYAVWMGSEIDALATALSK